MIWREQIGLVKKLSLRKLFNALMIFFSYHFSRLFAKPLLIGMPVSISFEPTTSCNLRCPECPSGLRSFTRSTGMLTMELFKKVIEENSSHLIYLNLYFQGEPYLNPNFLEMVKWANNRKIYCSTSTNAHYLNDEIARETILSGLDRLIISIDGVQQESYEKYRVGGSLSKVIEGAQAIIRNRLEMKSKTPYVIFQFLVVRHNEQEIERMYELAAEIGVDEVRFKTAQVNEFENGNKLIPENEKYSRYRKLPGGRYVIKNKLLNQCWRMWSGTVITWDGKVVPCCFDKDAKHVLGDSAKQKLSEVWNSEAYSNFRKSILQSRKSIDICTNCSEGTKVWEKV